MLQKIFKIIKSYNKKQKSVKNEYRVKPLILIIEDEGLLSRMYSKKLENDGYDYDIAKNGVEGLDKAQSLLPDLILCDVMMPEKDGLTLLKELKKNKKTADIPVIMLSNLAEEKYVNEALENGAVTYLIKSDLLPAQVIAKIKEVLEARSIKPLVTK